MAKNVYRVVTQGLNGDLRIKDYHQEEELLKLHTQIGVDDCSTDLDLRGKPVLRGLIGPIPEGKDIVRYEAPDVFEDLTKAWSVAPTPRRRRKSTPSNQQPSSQQPSSQQPSSQQPSSE